MSTTLADKVGRLFRTKPSPRGKEYTYREVASVMSQQDSVTFSPAYVWQLRTGVKDNLTMRHLQARVRFFDVSPACFFDEELTEFADGHVRVLAAVRSDTLRRIAATLLGLSDNSLDVVLNLASAPTPGGAADRWRPATNTALTSVVRASTSRPKRAA